jgi:hypothetical protein
MKHQLIAPPERVPEPAAKAPEPAGTVRSRHPLPSRTARVQPPDGSADAALRALVSHVAGQLGIDAAKIELKFDGEAERHGARGLATGSTIHLTGEFSPATPAGRHLLAHEVAHVAQGLLPHASAQSLRHVHVPAEIEAEAFARRYASQRTGAPIKVPLPPNARAADRDFAALVPTVAQSRAAEIAKIIDLLSYGPFDWRVGDDDVLEAVQILASVSIGTAAAMAVHLGAKYRERLFSNLDTDHYSAHRAQILAVCWAVASENEFAAADYAILSHLTLEKLEPMEAAALADVAAKSPKMVAASSAEQQVRIGEARAFAESKEAKDAVIADLAEVDASERKEAEARTKTDPSLNALAERISTKLGEWHISDAEALELLDAAGEQCLTVKDPDEKFQALAAAITVERLDEWIENIPVKGLYTSERRRRAFIHLVATRPDYKNTQLADNLMSSPWWHVWDTVTSEEAFLAYMLVKALPPRGRATFLKARGGEKWSAVLAELPTNIRESAAFNFYTGGEHQDDREALLTELTDPALWTEKGRERLEALSRLALAADEGAFLFEQSKRHRADRVPALAPLVERHGLFVKGSRETYQETELKGHAWYEEGALGTIGGLGNSLSVLFGLRNVHVVDGLGADVDLTTLGEAGGARFSAVSDKEKDAARAAGRLPTNTVRAARTFHGTTGEISVSANRLEIARLAAGGGTRINGGPITCEGLSLSFVFNRDDRSPISLRVGFDRLFLREAVMATDASLITLNALELLGARARLGRETFGSTAMKSVGFWKSLYSWMDPLFVVSEMFGGLVDPKGAMSGRIGVDRLRMLGLATSTGTFVQSVDVEGFVVQAGGTAESYLDALRASAARIQERIAPAKTSAKDRPDEAEVHTKRVQRLEKQLAKVQAEIKAGRPHGAVVDVGRITVRGLPMMGEEPLDIQDVHGQGSSVAAVMPLFTDPSVVEQLVRGKDNVRTPTVAGQVPINPDPFSIDIGLIERKTPLVIAAAIPTEKQAEEEYDEFLKANAARRTDPAVDAVEKALRKRKETAAEYAKLAAKGVRNLRQTRLPGETVDEATRFQNLRAELIGFEERRATIVDSFRLEGASLSTASAGTPELAAETLAVGTIRTFNADGSEALRIGAISGTDVSLGASIAGGISKAKDWRKTLEGVDVKARELTLTDIRHAGTGAAIEELSFESEGDAKGLELGFRHGSEATGGASVTAKSHRIRAKGVSIPAHAALLRAEKERIVGIDPKNRSKEEAERIETIEAMLKDLAALEEAKASAKAAVAKPATPKAREAAAKQLAKAEQGLKDWQQRLVIQQLTVEKLDLAVRGLGDVFASGYDFTRDAKALQISAGESGKWFEKVTAEGIRSRGAKGDQTVAERIVVGPVGGTVRKTEHGWKLTGFTIGEIAAKSASWSGGGISVGTQGESKLLGIVVDAELVESKGRKDLTLTHARIGRIVADRLRYEDADKVISVTSGELIGLDLSGLEVGIPEGEDAKTELDGGISIDAVKSLTLDAVAGGYRIGATLDAPAPKREGAHALSVAFAKGGQTTLDIKGLSARINATELATGNRVQVAWKNLSGTLVQNGDDYTIRGLSIPDLTLSHLDWSAGGKRIQINDRVTLQGIALDAEASLRPKPSKPGAKPELDAEGKEKLPEKELAKLLIKRLQVSTISAKDVQITIAAVEADKTKGIDYEPQKVFHLGDATISGLVVTGFDVLANTGKVEVTKGVKVTDLRTTIGEAARGDLKSATLALTMHGKDAEEPGKGGRELSATLSGKDGTTIRLGRTDSLALTDIWAMGESDTKRGKDKSVTTADSINLAGITTGDLVIKEDSVAISDIEVAGPVGMANVRWSVTGASKQLVTMEGASIPEPMRIGRIAAGFKKVPTGKIVAGKEETRSELDVVSVGDLAIPKLVATKLHYEGPLEDKTGKITGSAIVDMPHATVEGIALTKFEKNFGNHLTTLNAKLKSATVRNFALSVAETVGTGTATKSFGANIDVGEVRANAIFRTDKAGTPDEATALQDGGFELDSVALRNITGKLGGTGKKVAAIGLDTGHAGALAEKGQKTGLELTGIKHDKEGTKIAGAALRGLTYKDPNLGLTLDLQELLVPQEVAIPKKGPITIPEARITNAFFQLDDLMTLASGGSEGAGGAGAAMDVKQFYNILDHVNGHLTAEAYVPIYLFDSYVAGERYLRQDVFPVDMVLKDGKFDYRETWRKATWARNDAVASLTMDTDAVEFVDTPDGPVSVPDWSEAYLTLSAFSKNIIEWHPDSEAERTEMMAGQARLKRIIRPTDTDTEEEKNEKKKKEGEKQAVNPAEIELHKVDAALSIKGYIPLDLGAIGRIALGTPNGDALTELKLSKVYNSNLTWTLKQMAVTVEQLNLGTTTLKGQKDGGAVIRIDALEGGVLEFGGGKVMNPKKLAGTVTSGSITNVALELGE